METVVNGLEQQGGLTDFRTSYIGYVIPLVSLVHVLVVSDVGDILSNIF